jgi:putative Ca2+/H+ antiporter (TMEM165/GDT1 family)
MEPLLVSTGVVALAEIGDKTQLLALLLATRFRRPTPIVLGILAATLANHALAAWLGSTVAGWLQGALFAWLLGASFVAMGLWVLRPDSLDDMGKAGTAAGGAFLVALSAFFVAEIGDKTQIATVALAARFDDLAWVTAGTTLGMMLANVPVVLLGERAAGRLPLKPIRLLSAALFVLLGLLALWGAAVG